MDEWDHVYVECGYLHCNVCDEWHRPPQCCLDGEAVIVSDTPVCQLCNEPKAQGTCTHIVLDDDQVLMRRSDWNEQVAELWELRNMEAGLKDKELQPWLSWRIGRSSPLN